MKTTGTYNSASSRGPLMRELPMDERPREKLLCHGVALLSNTELLAILIGTGTREESAMGLAGRVLSSAGGLSGLGSLQAEEMSRIKGIGKAKACCLAAALELGRRMAACGGKNRVRVGNSGEAATLFQEEMRHLKKENFRCALLNVKNEVLCIENVSVGGICGTNAHPREVFEAAIRKGANAIIVAHNHPSGDPTPSDDDRELTRRLKESGEILGIKLLDHIIVGDGVYISMSEEGLL